MGVFFDSDKKKMVWAYFRDEIVYSANINGSDRQILADLGENILYLTCYLLHPFCFKWCQQVEVINTTILSQTNQNTTVKSIKKTIK